MLIDTRNVTMSKQCIDDDSQSESNEEMKLARLSVSYRTIGKKDSLFGTGFLFQQSSRSAIFYSLCLLIFEKHYNVFCGINLYVEQHIYFSDDY